MPKLSLELPAEKALPYLVDNLNQKNKYVKLQNTSDLIYPGATKFYGSGYVVYYDIDWLAMRIGWILEKITFENFGFRKTIFTEDDLLELAKAQQELSNIWIRRSFRR